MSDALFRTLYEAFQSMGDMWYHSTNKNNLANIQKTGLIINPTVSGYTQAGSWVKDVYGIQPIYFSKDMGRYTGENFVNIQVDLSGLMKFADLPSLVDAGMEVFEDGYVLNDKDGTWRDFINGKKPGRKTDMAIALTKTCCVLQNIDPSRIKI
jgi:hypothetical protein